MMVSAVGPRMKSTSAENKNGRAGSIMRGSRCDSWVATGGSQFSGFVGLRWRPLLSLVSFSWTLSPPKIPRLQFDLGSKSASSGRRQLLRGDARAPPRSRVGRYRRAIRLQLCLIALRQILL
jgi:hypothetical protein